MELVSCIIPTYKRSKMLVRTINSVLSQTYPEIEILVVDDNEPGSPESNRVKELIAGYDDNKVRYIGQKTHVNGAVARNEGIKNARGKYIAFLDDDDEWLPMKLERQVNYLERHKRVDGVTCLYKTYNNGNEISRCVPYSSKNLQFKVLLHRVSMYTSTFIGKKETILKMGGFNPSLLRNQDIQLFSDFLEIGRIEPIPDYMVVLHQDSDLNRKGIQKTIDAKQTFFKVEKKIIRKYDKKRRKRIYAAHYFDIVINAIRQREYLIAIKYLIKVGITFDAYLDLLKRYSIKQEGKKLVDNRA